MAEFPMVAVLIVMIALLVIQAALIVHTRNTLVDAAVQGAHHAALAGSTPQDGAHRAQQLVDERFGRGLEAEATAVQEDDGTIRVQVDATLPLVGLIGPAGALSVEGRAVDEEAW
ncbi:TadE/TadG family type IV pilus assembly protein [Brachybacterium sp. GU-2]|uniref:TadE/TadG family type IV pilus assembly protein n=1 Tax=Brachybacterium sp. GU-2 TaxID=3069708 RepID=UPI00280AA227|nr:TadE/TadG family type IV pilus assembly protein [Brachybacterium sp. GU-2]WME21677.1 pilus assembly protein [Brachybacterium sp. GU-2]